MVFDALNFLTFVQTTGSATVEAFDFETDSLNEDSFTYTNVFDLGAASPNYLGQSIYAKPREDTSDNMIADGTDGTCLLQTKLMSGATSTPTTDHGGPIQIANTEMIEMPLPQGVGRYIKFGFQSDGGAGAADIDAGAIAVWIGKSGLKE